MTAGRPKKPRYEAYELIGKHAGHKHKMGPFIVLEDKKDDWIVRNERRDEWRLRKRVWRLEECNGKQSQQELTARKSTKTGANCEPGK